MAVKIGEAVVKVLTRINELEKKLLKLEKNFTISGMEFGAISKPQSIDTSIFKSSTTVKQDIMEDGLSTEAKTSRETTKVEKSALIAEIQEAQRRKVEKDPNKRKEFIDQKENKENLLKASILKAQEAMQAPPKEAENTLEEDKPDDSPDDEVVPSSDF